MRRTVHAGATSIRLIYIAGMAPNPAGMNSNSGGLRASRAWPAFACVAALCGVATLIAISLAGYLDLASLVLVFMLAVVLAGAWFGRGPALLAATLSVALFNVLFVPPRFSLAVADKRLFFTLVVMLLIGLIVGHLTASLRAQASAAREGERRVRSLYDISRKLGSALTVQQIEEITGSFIDSQMAARATLWVKNPNFKCISSSSGKNELDRVAEKVISSGQAEMLAAGFAHDASALFLPLCGTMSVRGALALEREGPAQWTTDERRFLDTCAALIGSALDRIHYIEVARDTAIQIESERLRNALLSAISHDLRTPLSSMVGLAESLSLTRPSPTVEQASIAEAVASSARRMSAMVNNLLDMARVESETVQLNLEWLPVEELFGSALAAADHLMAGHRVVIEVPEDMPLIRLDPVLMERVLVNLLENAAKYTPPGSTVTLSASALDTGLELRVSDNGPGLPAGRNQDLFRKFERGTRESATPGVGLGLALCRAIVKAHGGSIQEEGAASGGACFVMSFARGEPPGIPPEPESAREAV